MSDVFIVGADIFEFTSLFEQPAERIEAHIARQNSALVLQRNTQSVELVLRDVFDFFLTARFTKLSDDIYEPNVSLSGRKLRAGALLSIVGTLGYYSAYVWVIWKTLAGALSIVFHAV